MQRVEVVAVEAVFHFAYFEEVEPLKSHVGFGESIAPSRLKLCQKLQCGILRSGVHDELSKVAASHLRGVARHKPRRRTADETRHAFHSFVFQQHVAQRVGHGLGLADALSLGKEYLYGKLVAVGIGEKAHLQSRNDEQR